LNARERSFSARFAENEADTLRVISLVERAGLSTDLTRLGIVVRAP
jgi:hypothetical protein